MAPRHSTPIPPELAWAPMKTVRPRDAGDVYAHPRAEFARLTERLRLHRVANGYYIVVPQDMVGRRWMPGLEAAAAGIASAIYGADAVCGTHGRNRRYGPTNHPPTSRLFTLAPTDTERQSQLAGQTRITISAEQAVVVVRDAWRAAVASNR